MYSKLTYDQIKDIRKRMARHARLIEAGDYAKARQDSPKIIGAEYGVNKEICYRIRDNENYGLFTKLAEQIGK